MIYKPKAKGKPITKFYWVKFMFEGQVIRQSTGETSLQKAKDYEAVLRTQLRLGKIGVEDLKTRKKQLLFKDALQEMLGELQDIKDSTRSRYETAAKPLIAFFGAMPVDKICESDVIRYRQSRLGDRCKAPIRKLKKDSKATTTKMVRPATINRETTVLGMVFRRLIKRGMPIVSPTFGMKLLKENNQQDRVVSRSDFEAYLAEASQPLKDIALCMYHCGMRPGEVYSLTSEDIDLDRGLIIIRQGKTDSARREFPLPDEIRGMLESRVRNSVNGLLFAGGKQGQAKGNPTGENPIVKVTNAHNAAVERANKTAQNEKRRTIAPFRLYDLRHTCATHLVEAGVDLETIRVLLGWSNLAMLKRYVHLSQEHKAGALQKLREHRQAAAAAASNVVPFRPAA